MSAPGDSPSAEARRREAVAALVAEALERFEAGGMGALRAYCAELDDHREQVTAQLAALERAGLLGGELGVLARRDPSGTDGDARSAAGTRAAQAHGLPTRLGDFEVLECLGGGGMGVVHRARQVSLGREVAIKLIRPEQVHFPGVRQRFQREVEIIAKLEHEGIVRLYSYGEDHGLPWFAMERIDGRTLAEVLQSLHGRSPRDVTGAEVARSFPGATASGAGAELFAGTWQDVAVRIVQRGAEALEAAHQQGVLHRDLKPSNIMLTARGRVVLLDFGLAWSHDTDRLTRSGAQVGTCHYMAPEQFRGDNTALDARTDVYALGVLLRELLTLRAVFDGATVDVIARAVQEGRPNPIDRRGSALTWEAETVCLVAMDPDPARRFPTAAALAEDLGNLLERRPIRAARPALALRLRRFAQRHRALSAAAGVVACALLLTPSAVAWRERELRRRIERMNGELAAEVERADRNLSLAADAMNRTLRRLNEEDVVQVPDLRSFSDGLVVDTADFLDALSSSNPNEPAARLWLAETLLQAGEVRWQLWDLPRTEAIFRRVIELLEDVTTEVDRADALRLEAQLALVFLGSRELGSRSEAYTIALEHVQRHGDVAQRSPALRALYARGLERLGSVQLQSDVPGALRVLRESLVMREALAREEPTVERWLEVAAGADALQQALRRAGDADGDAEMGLVLQQALDTAPTVGSLDTPELQRLGIALGQRAYRLRAVGDVEGAARLQRASSERWSELAAMRPSRLEGLWAWASSELRLASDLERLGRSGEARDVMRGATVRLAPALAVWPMETQLRTALLEARSGLARLFMEAPRQLEAARQELDLGAVEARAALEQQGSSAISLTVGARVFSYRARLALEDADLDRAEGELARAAELQAEAARRAPNDRVVLPDEFDRPLAQAELALRRARPAEAAAALASMRKLPPDLLSRVPALSDWLGDPHVAPQVARLAPAR